MNNQNVNIKPQMLTCESLRKWQVCWVSDSFPSIWCVNSFLPASHAIWCRLLCWLILMQLLISGIDWHLVCHLTYLKDINMQVTCMAVELKIKDKSRNLKIINVKYVNSTVFLFDILSKSVQLYDTIVLKQQKYRSYHANIYLKVRTIQISPHRLQLYLKT